MQRRGELPANARERPRLHPQREADRDRTGLREAIGTFRPSPGRPPRMIRVAGEKKTAKDWANDARCAVSASTIPHRLGRSWTPAEAITVARMKPGGQLGKTSTNALAMS